MKRAHPPRHRANQSSLSFSSESAAPLTQTLEQSHRWTCQSYHKSIITVKVESLTSASWAERKKEDSYAHTRKSKRPNLHTYTHSHWFFISVTIIPSTEHKLELVLTALIKKCLIGAGQQTFIFKCSLKSLSSLIKAHKALMVICQSCQSQQRLWMGLIWRLRGRECVYVCVRGRKTGREGVLRR